MADETLEPRKLLIERGQWATLRRHAYEGETSISQIVRDAIGRELARLDKLAERRKGAS